MTSHNGITLKLQPTIRQYKQSDFNKQSDSHAGNYSGFGVYFSKSFFFITFFNKKQYTVNTDVNSVTRFGNTKM